MVQKLNPNVRNFLILGMGIGFGIIAIAELGDFAVGVDFRFTGFDILQVQTDPITGEIIGSVVIGKPVQAGYGWTGAKKSVNCPLNTQSIQKNSQPTWSGGTSSGGCQFGFAEWDVSDLPDDFDATKLQLKFKQDKLLSISQIPNRSCRIGIIEQAIDTIAFAQFNTKLFNPDITVLNGDWCQTLGIKTVQLDAGASDAFERAVRGDDRFTLTFTMSTITKGGGCCPTIDINYWATEGSVIIDGKAKPVICPVGTEIVGFQCVALECDVGFEVNGNICSAIQCSIGEQLIGSICTPIQCQVGEQLIGNDCSAIICAVGTTLIGNDCDQIVCNDGFTLSGNECTPIVCPVGNELVGSSCQTIACPIGTFLQGNNCVDIICPIGTILEASDCSPILCDVGENLVGNICQPLQCQLGERLVGNNCETITCEVGFELIGSECTEIQCPANTERQGDQCVDVALNCPVGTLERENVCVQLIPQLQATGAPVSLLTITGVGIFLISFGGFIVRGIVRKGF